MIYKISDPKGFDPVGGVRVIKAWAIYDTGMDGIGSGEAAGIEILRAVYLNEQEAEDQYRRLRLACVSKRCVKVIQVLSENDDNVTTYLLKDDAEPLKVNQDWFEAAEALKKQALAKLTDEEKEALGLCG